MFLSRKQHVHHELWDFWVGDDHILRKVPKCVRPEFRYVIENSQYGKAHVLTKSGNVYQLTPPDEKYLDNNNRRCNGVEYRLIKELCNKDVKGILQGYFYLQAFSDYKVMSVPIPTDRHDTNLPIHVAEFDQKVNMITPSATSSVNVFLENNETYHIDGPNSMKLDLKEETVIKLCHTCFMGCGITKRGKVAVWSKLTVPGVFILSPPKEDMKILKIKSRFGVLNALTEDGVVLQWDLLQIMLMTLYKDITDAQGLCFQPIVSTLMTIFNYLPPEVKKRTKKQYENFMETREFPKIMPPTQVRFKKRIRDIVSTNAKLFILDEDHEIWEIEINRNNEDELVTDTEPQRSRFKSWHCVRVATCDGYPLTFY